MRVEGGCPQGSESSRGLGLVVERPARLERGQRPSGGAGREGPDSSLGSQGGS